MHTAHGHGGEYFATKLSPGIEHFSAVTNWPLSGTYGSYVYSAMSNQKCQHNKRCSSSCESDSTAQAKAFAEAQSIILSHYNSTFTHSLAMGRKYSTDATYAG